MLSLRRHRRQRGMTFVEIAVVLTVIALALFAVVPDMTSLMHNVRIRSVADSMLADMQRARMEATRHNQPVTFWLMSSNGNNQLDATCALSASGTSWVVSRADPSGSCQLDPSETDAPIILSKHDAGDGGSVVAVSASAADHSTPATSISFDGYGRVVGGTLRFVDINSVTPGTNFRPLRLELTNAGVIRLCEPRLSSTGTDPRRCLYS